MDAKQSIAILEVTGYTTAYYALDEMLKSANVVFLHSEKKLGGQLVTVIVGGSTSEVTAALEVGQLAASEIGQVVGAEIIGKPHPEIMKFITAVAR